MLLLATTVDLPRTAGGGAGDASGVRSYVLTFRRYDLLSSSCTFHTGSCSWSLMLVGTMVLEFRPVVVSWLRWPFLTEFTLSDARKIKYMGLVMCFNNVI